MHQAFSASRSGEAAGRNYKIMDASKGEECVEREGEPFDMGKCAF